MNRRLRMQKGDILAIVLVVLLAVLTFICFLPEDDAPALVQIYQDGKLMDTLALNEDQEVTLTSRYSCTVTIRDGKVAVTGSDCPGADCVHSGWIGSSGRSIVCLPNALELRVVAGNSDVDFVVG